MNMKLYDFARFSQPIERDKQTIGRFFSKLDRQLALEW